MRRDKERLQDIVEAIERIEKYAVGGKGVFEKDELVQTWIVHHVQIIGEAASQVSKEFKEHRSDVPWKEIVMMRNILVHEYFKIAPLL